MTSHSFFWAAGRRPRKQHGAIGTLLLVVVLSTLSLSSPSSAQSDSANPDKVRLCNLSYSIKIKSFGRQLKAVNQAYVDAWQKKRPEDNPSRCRRLYAASDESRLSKLVAIGKAEKATHLIAPTAGKKGKEIEVSFWLVDVENGAVIDQVSQTFPATRNQLKSELPAFSQKAVEQFLPRLGAIEADPAKSIDKTLTSEDKDPSETVSTTADSMPATEPEQAQAQEATKTGANTETVTETNPDTATRAADDEAGEKAAEAATEAGPQSDETSLVENTSASASDNAAAGAGPGSASTPETPSATGAKSAANTQPGQADGAAAIPVRETEPAPDAAPPVKKSTQKGVQADATSTPHATTPPIWKQGHFMPLAAAAVGAVTGAGLGALLHNVAIAERKRSTDGVADLGQSIWVGGLMGAGVGALAGAWLSTTDLSGSEVDDRPR